MSVCTFFGHRDTPKKIETILQSTLIDLIENKNVEFFFVGNQGAFDSMVKKHLKLLKLDYPHITYAVVLPYLPVENDRYDWEYYLDTIYPDGLEKVPRKYAIDRRNRWMVNESDYVVTYVTHNFGGAAKFKEFAQRKGKTVINLADYE